MLFGSQFYNSYLKHYELRTLMKIGSVITICLSPLYMCLVFRKNLEYGIPDAALIIFDESVGEIISQAFISMPMMVLYAKITPPHIEATCFAMLASSSNLRETISGMIGATINEKFVGVTKDDMSNYWILVSITYACSILPLLLINWLVPSKDEIQAMQDKLASDKQTAVDKED